jgi:hypothetical protein
MKFMMLLKATKDTEADVPPDEKAFAAMGQFNEEMVKAGVMVGGEGLHPTSRAARVTFKGGKPSVEHGPFSFSGDLIAGFWMIQVNSLEEAIAWAKRVPFDPDVHMGGEGQIELRRIFEADDFGDALTPELRAQEERLRAEAAAQKH